MKKLVFVLVAGAFIATTACNNGPKGESAQVAETQQAANAAGAEYKVDAAASTLQWSGYGPATKEHKGTFKITDGKLAVANGQLTGGSFTVDINSLVNSDLEGEYKTKLETHLKSADFFNAEKYPSAKFEITGVQPLSGDSVNNYTVSGNLTLKDSTKNISFPAKINVSDAAVDAKATFTINRTWWGMAYGNDQSLGDKFIKPEVGVSFDIKASK